MLILKVPLFVSITIINKHLLHIIPNVCAEIVTQISSITLLIILNLANDAVSSDQT